MRHFTGHLGGTALARWKKTIAGRLLGWVMIAFGLGAGAAGASAADAFRITSVEPDPAGGWAFRHEARSDAYYLLLQGPEPGAVQVYRDAQLGRGPTGVLRDADGSAAAGFYRIRAVPLTEPLDADNDGIDDVYELLTPGLNPLLGTDAALPAPNSGGLTFLEVYRQVTTPLTGLVESSPFSGETGVSVTRETVVRFSEPLAAGTTLGIDRFFATFGGRRILSRTTLSGDRQMATLFHLEPLPASARVRVTLVGDGVRDQLGRELDLDGDGRPGGSARIDFETLSNTPVPNTAVTGFVYASEPEPDGRGGFTNRPLERVTITVDGAEQSLRTTTDARGFFRLMPCPAGQFFVHIDGRTSVSSDWPAGSYYPVVGKVWEGMAGDTNRPANSAGTVFLPKVAAGTLQPVSATGTTLIEMPASVLAQNPSMQGVRLVVPPNALFSDDGIRGGLVGLAPVASDRLPEPLPKGIRHSIDISVQTDGPQNFDQPVPIRFPNLPDPVTGLKKPPGAESVLWSFNHDFGRWEMVGPMTVTADGNFVETEPGFGVVQPGWHGEDPSSIQRKKPCPPLSWTEGVGIVKTLFDCAGDLTKVADIISKAVSAISLATDSVNAGIAAGKAIKKKDYSAATLRDLTQKLIAGKQAALELSASFAEGASPVGKGIAIAKCIVSIAKTTLDLICNRKDSEENDCKGWVTGWVCDRVQPVLNLAANFIATLENAQKGLGEAAIAALCAAINNAIESTKVLETVQSRSGAAKAGRPGLQDDPALTAAEARLVADLEAVGNLGAFLTPATEWVKAAETAALQLQRQLRFLERVGRMTPDQAAAAAHKIVIAPPGGGPTRQSSGPAIETHGNSWAAAVGSSYRVDVYYPAFGVVATHSGIFPSLRSLRGRPRMVQFQKRNELTDIRADFFTEVGEGPDADTDDVPDAVETLLGIDPAARDTDRDGVPDGVELTEGTDPLSPGTDAAVGIRAAVALPGPALDVCAIDARALVAMGASGIAILDLPPQGNPTIIARIDTPGAARRVACERNLVAVADGPRGLAIVDIADPPAARIVRQISLPGVAQAVVIVDGIAYVGSDSGRIAALHLASGTPVGSLTLPGSVNDLAVERDLLFAVTPAGLHVIRLGEALQSIGFLPLTGETDALTGVRRVALGGGLAYVADRVGFATVDVSDPAHPRLVAPSSNFGPGSFKQVVPTGSGLGIAAVGISPGDPDTHDVWLFDLANPQSTTNFLDVLETPGVAMSVAMHAGRVLVADAAAGLEVLNPVRRDIGTNAPTVTLLATFPLDPPVAEEGRLVAITADARDDVIVRHVDFFLDGQFASRDAAYPFEWVFRAPRLLEGTNSFRLQARALDLAGNEAWTPVLEVAISADTVGPLAFPTQPTVSGSAANLATLGVFFSEPVESTTLTPASFHVVAIGPDRVLGSADDRLVPGTLRYDGTARLAMIDFGGPLPSGRYVATVTRAVTDTAGNPLAQEVVWAFQAIEGADGDGDGLPDTFELANGMNPSNADENANGVPDSLDDFDGDSLDNATELVLETNPRNPRTFSGQRDQDLDRDGEHLPDAAELPLGTDWLHPDSDGDGWTDEIEVVTGANPLIRNAYLPGTRAATGSPVSVLRPVGDRATKAGASVLRLVEDRSTRAGANVLRQASPNLFGSSPHSAVPAVEIRRE